LKISYPISIVVRHQLSLNLLANIYNNYCAIRNIYSFDGIPISLQLAQNCWARATCTRHYYFFSLSNEVQNSKPLATVTARMPTTLFNKQVIILSTYTHPHPLAQKFPAFPATPRGYDGNLNLVYNRKVLTFESIE